MSEENAERIVVGIAALLEFMMEDHARVGDSPPAVLGVFECANGGARPTVGNIRAFLGDMAQLCRYTLECNVVALILLIRFFSCQPNLRLSPNTWRRYLLCAIMVAQKFWDDRCLRNIDLTVAWRCVLPDAGALPLRDVNLMECHFLAGLGYDLYIQPAKYGACLSRGPVHRHRQRALAAASGPRSRAAAACERGLLTPGPEALSSFPPGRRPRVADSPSHPRRSRGTPRCPAH